MLQQTGKIWSKYIYISKVMHCWLVLVACIYAIWLLSLSYNLTFYSDYGSSKSETVTNHPTDRLMDRPTDRGRTRLKSLIEIRMKGCYQVAVSRSTLIYEDLIWRAAS